MDPEGDRPEAERSSDRRVQILKLAAEHPDLLTAPGGKPYGSMKALIDCPVVGYLTTEPTEDLIKPVPGSAVDFPGAYSQK